MLIHGIGSSWRVFEPVLPMLEAKHEVLAVNLPGFGGAEPLPITPTIPALADAVAREIVSAGFDTPHIAGNSLGGWVALELARRRGARSVVGLSPGGMHTDRERAFITASLRATFAAARRAAPHAELLTRTAAGRTLLFAQVFARPWALAPDAAADTLRTLAGADAFLPTLESTLGSDRASGLEQIRCPATIAWGTRDLLLFPRQGPRFVRAIPGAELRPLPGLGHVPMFDDPEATARVVLETTAPTQANGAPAATA